MKFFRQSALSALALLSIAYAQISSDCNPMNSTCSPNTALGVSNYTIDFTQSIMTTRVWNTTAGAVKYGDDGAQFIVNQKGDTPTVKSRFYIFFGQLEVIMKAATGQGIVSSIVLLSDTLDEVDWEWIGGNNSYVQSNYFGKGNTTSYDRAVWHPVNDAQGQFHNYTVNWTPEALEWYIDSQLIRTLKYEEANGGHNFPQTPCDVRLGIWAGGDSDNNEYTIEWAGGETDYSKGPYTMTVQSVRIKDASTGTQYEYGDRSGSMQSIKVLNSTAPIKLDGENSGSSAQSAAQRWNNLSSGAKIAIGCSIAAVFLIGFAVFGFCCIKQRRIGKHERLVEDAKFEKDRAELMAYRSEMSRQRSQYIATHGSAVHGGTMGATIQQPMPNMPRNFSQGNYNPGYAQSTVSSMNSGRGYQRY